MATLGGSGWHGGFEAVGQGGESSGPGTAPPGQNGATRGPHRTVPRRCGRGCWHVATLHSGRWGLKASSLSIDVIGQAIACPRDRGPKDAVKDSDRLLSNANLTIGAFAPAWIRFVVSTRERIVVALDWTESDDDGHSMIAVYLPTSHGWATPLV